MTYADYLRQAGIPLFDGAGITWQFYQGALIPASPLPTFADIGIDTCRRLLDESNAYLIRWSSDPSNQETPWWWVICDEYDFSQLPSKIRGEIRRGRRGCIVRRISATWLAEFGYECYKKAFARYRYSKPVVESEFRFHMLQKLDFEKLFEYWGIFVEDKLAGYVECIIEDQGVATSIIKYDPDYLQYYISYATIDTLLTHYVTERGLPINNSTRSISHDTNIQDFLLKFGFRRQYCRLNVQYNHYIELVILLLYPVRRFLPDWRIIQKPKSLLFQEELRRACH